jgi:6-phosphogluconolactonase
VAAFTVDKVTGDLTLINRVSSGGNSPVHMEVDAEGKYAVVSLLGEGTVGLFPLLGSQGIGNALDLEEEGVGPHQTILDEREDGTSAIVCDMRSNEVRVHNVEFYNATAGELMAPLATLQMADGAGPRHSVLGANGDVVYIANENGNTVTVASYNPLTGALSEVQTLDTLRDEDVFNPPLDPNGAYPQQMAASSIVLDPSGGYVIVSNRDLRDLGGAQGRDTVAVYKISPSDGTLELTQHMWTGGQFPRHIGFDPSGSFLYAANQLSNNIVAFSFDVETGKLSPAGAEASVGAGPTHLLFA